MPRHFDLAREDVGAHVVFGAGPHYCAGAAASKSLIAEGGAAGCCSTWPACASAAGQNGAFDNLAFQRPDRAGGLGWHGRLSLPDGLMTGARGEMPRPVWSSKSAKPCRCSYAKFSRR